jgi:hypothetical protein
VLAAWPLELLLLLALFVEEALGASWNTIQSSPARASTTVTALVADSTSSKVSFKAMNAVSTAQLPSFPATFVDCANYPNVHVLVVGFT